MPQNVFTLRNDGDKIGVYANEALVNGSTGTQTVVIGPDAATVTLSATMERADVAFASSALTFRVNPDTLLLEVWRGDTIMAAFVNNPETGTVLACTDGGVTAQLVENAAGDVVFQVRAGSETQELSLGGSRAPLAIAPDASLASEMAPPTPAPEPPSPKDTLTVQEAWEGLDAGTLTPGEFTVMDTAAHLRDAPYVVIACADGVVLRDSVDALVRADGTPTSAATAALDMAGSVVVADSLSSLLVSELPDFGKPTTLLVTGKLSDSVTLTNVTVAVAADAQNELDAFLARTDVFFEAGDKPERLTIASYSLRDSVANITGADSALLNGAEGITLADDMAAVSGAPLSLLGRASAVEVEDSLANMAEARVSTSFLQALLNANASFTATDDPGYGGAVSVDAFGLQSFGLVDGASITLRDSVREINFFASAPVGMKPSPSTSVNMKLDIFDGFTGTLNFTGSDGDDCVTVSAQSRITGGVIDAGDGDNIIDIHGGTLDRIAAGEGTYNILSLYGGAVSVVEGTPGKDNIGLSHSRAGDAIFVNGKGGPDVISLDNASETVAVGVNADLTHSNGAYGYGPSGTGDSTATVIKNFTPFSNGTGDKLALATHEGFLDGLQLGEVVKQSGTGALAVNRINLHNGSTADTVDQVRRCFHSSFGSGYAFLAKDTEVVLVTNSYDSAHAGDKLLHLWYVKGGPDEGSAGDDLVVLLGSVRFDVPFKSFSINILTPDCFTTLDSL